jgi:Domain of unknown function (DUF5134)
MTGPPWLAGVLAALMILVAASAAARLCWLRPRGRPAQADGDVLHVLMGAAMAGMFEPGIGPVPAVAWQVVFAAAAAWFTWQAIRRRGTIVPAPYSHPASHVVECGAMLYMLWPAAASHRPGSMPGMTGHAGAVADNPALALVLAVCMLGYIVWAIDQLLARRPATARIHAGAGLQASDMARQNGGTRSLRKPASPRPGHGSGPPHAPRLAACQKITMGLAMGYMLVTML